METQTIEYKQTWRDDFLKEICEFTNAQGGTLYIGIADWTIFYNKISPNTEEKSSQKSSQKILVLIESDPIISAKEIAEKLGITSRSVEKHIKNLRDKGILRRVGPDKGGHWEIVE